MSDGAEQSDGPFEQRVGERLSAERKRQDLELSAVAGRLRIPLRHLEAIETGDHSKLPALPYAAGFVKSYATMLGLDGIALSREFRAEVGNEQRGYFEPEAYAPVDPSRVPSRMLAMVALGVALLLGLGYLLLRFEGDSSDLAKLAADTPQEINAMAAVPRAAKPAPVPAAPVVPTGPIRVTAIDRDVWVKIGDRASGTVLFRGVIKLGDNFEVPDSAADPVLRVLLPQYIKVSVGDAALPPVGSANTLVADYSLKREALVAKITAAPVAPAPAAVPVVATPGDAATLSAGDNATEAAPLPRPRRRHVVPPADPAAGSRPDTTQPVSADTPRQEP